MVAGILLKERGTTSNALFWLTEESLCLKIYIRTILIKLIKICLAKSVKNQDCLYLRLLTSQDLFLKSNMHSNILLGITKKLIPKI